MRVYHYKNTDRIDLSNIVFAFTTERDYEMSRLILLENMPNTEHGEYVLAEGGHCSCYGFDDTYWDMMVYPEAELITILQKEEYDRARIALREFLKKY